MCAWRQIPDDIWNSQYHSYRLHVRGTGGLQIEETYSVRVETVIASIFVQTDKDTYQPGETGSLITCVCMCVCVYVHCM